MIRIGSGAGFFIREMKDCWKLSKAALLCANRADQGPPRHAAVFFVGFTRLPVEDGVFCWNAV